MAEEAVITQSEPAPVSDRRRYAVKAAKWGGGALAALIVLLIAGLLLLNTSIGHRFIADVINKQTFANGLEIHVGRIEGNIYGSPVVHDVRFSDPKGVFLTVPRAEGEWHPFAWFENTLHVEQFTARRGELLRLPELLPSQDDTPILPGFDVKIDNLVIDNLTLAPGVAGENPQRVDLTGAARIENRHLFVDANASLGQTDKVKFLINAEPDGDDFDLSASVETAANGAIAKMLGLTQSYTAQLGGGGTWTAWNGQLLVRDSTKRVAAIKLTNRSGLFGVNGKIDPSDFVGGTLADALGNDISLHARLKYEDSAVTGRSAIVGRGVYLDGDGTIDLGNSRVDDYDIVAEMRDPELFGDNLRMENARATATVNGPFSNLVIAHDVRIGRLQTGTTTVLGLTQRGTARYSRDRLILPLDMRVARIETGNAQVDPRLVNGVGQGQIVLAGSQLSGNDLRIAFPGLAANLAVRGNTAAGRYQIRGPVRADGLVIENIGRAGGTAMIDFDLAQSGWRLDADLDARVDPVTNDTMVNFAGPIIRARGGISSHSNAGVDFRQMRISSKKLAMVLDGSVQDGTTKIAGRGEHLDYGPFTVQARIADGGPTAELVFAKPFTGVENVHVAIEPTQKGFGIDTNGDSVLGPFNGHLGIYSPETGPTLIDIETLTVSNTTVTGGLALVDGGADGSLTLSGGGLDGTIDLAPRSGGQGVDVNLAARNASFGGSPNLLIALADIKASGLIADGTSSFSGTATAQGISYGTLFIGRLDARGEVENGVGRVDANVSGRRGGRFALDVNALFRSGQIGVAAQGEFGGKRISMPRRAVLNAMESGGWQLEPTQINFGSGSSITSGRFGAGETALKLQLSGMPLSLADLVVADLGLGGTISGVIDYSAEAGELPTGNARVKVDDLSRSGLVLTSKPVDLMLLAKLGPQQLEARAVLQNEDIKRGRIQALIADLPASGTLTERLRAGRLDAQLRYRGAAESLWRLAAIDVFDITGPVSIAANATGTLNDPSVRGSVKSSDLRVQSSLSGTDIKNVSVRGVFAGSRLQLTSFSGTAPNGGTITGSGIIDMAGLGERVEGRFVEVRGPALDLRASAKNAKVLDANGLTATITGPLRIVSDGLGGTLAGRVSIDRASWKLGTFGEDYSIPRISTHEINLPPDRAPEVSSSRPWRYLIDAKGSSRIDVDGMGLESEWGANIRLRGTTADPRIGGTASVVRGDYTFAGTRFELTKGEIAFDEAGPIDPRLDIQAETEASGTDVVVTIKGSGLQPEVAFTSDPALPEEEILSRLLFGGSITTLSATDALQLGAAVASLRGGGGLDPINKLRSAIGLDRLRIVSADAALGRGTSVAMGKNFGRRFYVEIVTDGRGYSATSAEFRVTSWLSLLASVSTIGRESVVAEIKRDY